jgi:hypothetical protein
VLPESGCRRFDFIGADTRDDLIEMPTELALKCFQALYSASFAVG